MNYVTLSGNLGADMDLRGTPNGFEGELSVAVSDYAGRDDSGAPRMKTTWVTVVVFGDRARALQDSLMKGRKVWVKGKLASKPYKVGEKTLRFTYISVGGPDDTIEFDPSASRSNDHIVNGAKG